jgi:hypothetical protein
MVYWILVAGNFMPHHQHSHSACDAPIRDHPAPGFRAPTHRQILAPHHKNARLSPGASWHSCWKIAHPKNYLGILAEKSRVPSEHLGILAGKTIIPLPKTAPAQSPSPFVVNPFVTSCFRCPIPLPTFCHLATISPSALSRKRPIGLCLSWRLACDGPGGFGRLREFAAGGKDRCVRRKVFS